MRRAKAILVTKASSMCTAVKLLYAASSPGAQPASDSLSSPSSLPSLPSLTIYADDPIYTHTPPPLTTGPPTPAVPTHPFTSPYCHTTAH